MIKKVTQQCNDNELTSLKVTEFSCWCNLQNESEESLGAFSGFNSWV